MDAIDLAPGPRTPGIQDRVILSICNAGSRCGCAVYHDSSIRLIADRRELGDPFKGLDITIQQMDPDIVIVSGAQRQFITYLEKRFNFSLWDIHNKFERPTPDEISAADFALIVVPNMWYAITNCEAKLMQSEWVTRKRFSDSNQALFFVASKIKKSVDVCALRAISAIDKFLTHEFVRDSVIGACQQVSSGSLEASDLSRQIKTLQSQFSQNKPDDNLNLPECLMPILNVSYSEPGPILSIDKFTLGALKIFPDNVRRSRQVQTDIEPNTIPCLYDLLNLCQSSVGKKMLHTIMVWPSQDIEELRRRHDTIEYFLRPENKLFCDQLIIQLRSITPLSGLLTKLSHAIGSYKEMSIVYKTLWSVVAIIDLIKGNEYREIELLTAVVNADSAGLRTAIDSIINIIDFDASKRDKRLQVCIGVDKAVDDKKEVAKNLAKFCDNISVQETAKYKNILGKTCRVIYLPRIGFLNSVEYSTMKELQNMNTSPLFDVLLNTESSVYFKTERMEELDNDAGDIACDLIDVQESIVVDLQSDILTHSDLILRLLELLGMLDCLIAFALLSKQKSFVRPELVMANEEIDIRDAYHPLQSVRQNSIPNDIKFFDQILERTAKVMIITGPNSCGKTTYMKASCLVVYMAHIGCFVPATSARIPLVDSIFTRMHSSNSISTGLSSFASDLHQINYALERATEKSFIAIDEFGKGTQARDGFHLLKGLVMYFAIRASASPHVMISTHFNRLIDHLQDYSRSISWRTFKVSRDVSQNLITYEYKLIDGVSEASLADQVAASAGVPQIIIDRAKEVRVSIISSRPILPRAPRPA